MSQLRSVIDDFVSCDPDVLSAEELADEISEAMHCQQLLETAVADWVRKLADRGGHHQLGYSSPTAFLCDQTGMSPGSAKRVISHGNAREKAPHAYQAWVDGRISTDQARHLFRAAEAVPDSYPEAEERLVDIVEGLDAVDTGRTVEYWRQSVDGPGETDTETQMLRRGLSLSETIGGMFRVDGWLTSTAGAALEAAIDANTPP